MSTKDLNKRILASLAYTGRPIAWLAGRLGISERTVRRKLNNERPWEWPEVLVMKEVFRWKSLDQWEGI